MYETGDRQPKLGFLVLGGVATAQHRTGSGDALDRAGDHSMQDLRLELVGGKPDQTETRHWASAHRVDVTQGVGSRDLPEDEGIVDRRRDEVGGHHHRDFFVEPVDRRVVAGFEADQQVRVLARGKGLQQLVEPDRAQLGCSAAGLGQARQGRLTE